MITIRDEQPGDVAAVHALNEAAFDTPIEADIVDSLRDGCPGILSYVAVETTGETEQVVGHILFSPAVLSRPGGDVIGMGLAPMAVLPARQSGGIGSKLVRHGLAHLDGTDCPYVIVLGHPDYYPRFGFRPASAYGLRSQWEGVPDEVFLVIVRDEAAVGTGGGVVRYRDEFDEAM